MYSTTGSGSECFTNIRIQHMHHKERYSNRAIFSFLSVLHTVASYRLVMEDLGKCVEVTALVIQSFPGGSNLPTHTHFPVVIPLQLYANILFNYQLIYLSSMTLSFTSVKCSLIFKKQQNTLYQLVKHTLTTISNNTMLHISCSFCTSVTVDISNLFYTPLPSVEPPAILVNYLIIIRTSDFILIALTEINSWLILMPIIRLLTISKTICVVSDQEVGK